jgi:LacI family transcriptional regulator
MSAPAQPVTRTQIGIKDVARHAGVSVGTVSNVLNRPEIVSADTRDRVNATIRELGFVRNEQARQLKAGPSRTIAFVVLDAGNPFFTDVATGIEDVAEAAGLGVYICNSREQLAREARYLEMLGEQRVHGVLLTPIETSSPQIESLSRQGIPLVLVDRYQAGEDHCSVSVDDVLGGQLAVKHLLEGGHRRIGFVGDAGGLTQVKDRLAGAKLAIAEAGLPDASLHVIPAAAMDLEEGRLAAGRILGMPAEARVTAAFCANDLLALGLLQEMTRANVRVPQELAIVGYDDIYFASSAVVPLSSMRQPREELGRTAARLLLEEADAPDGHRHQQVRFEPQLVVRASSNWRIS